MLMLQIKVKEAGSLVEIEVALSGQGTDFSILL